MIDIKINNIDTIISKINTYKNNINAKEQLILGQLGKYGVDNAKLYYESAKNFDNDSPVSVEFRIENNTMIISASGEQVCFLEFGAGVYYNGMMNYPIPLPEGIVGIGEYGKGWGKRSTWFYYKNGDKSQGAIGTHGTKASKSMYETLCLICEKALDVAREVFNQ